MLNAGGSSSRATAEEDEERKNATGKANLGLLGFQFLLIDSSIQLGRAK
jgi:hypothetical protein